MSVIAANTIIRTYNSFQIKMDIISQSTDNTFANIFNPLIPYSEDGMMFFIIGSCLKE